MKLQFPRPTLQSDDVCQIAARMLITDEFAKEDWYDDVAKAIQHSRNTFDALKELDEMGWDISDEMIESFLGLIETKAIAREQAIAEWVKRHGVVAQLKPGSSHKLEINGTMQSVVIAEVLESSAQYRVVFSVPEKRGLQETLINYEFFHDLAAPSDQFALRATG